MTETGQLRAQVARLEWAVERACEILSSTFVDLFLHHVK